MERIQVEGWKLSLGLAVAALAAVSFVPRLAPQAEPAAVEAQASMDACLRLGPYECCYLEDGKR